MSELKIRGCLVAVCAVLCAPMAAECAVKHRVIRQDTLWDLAGRYYKDSFQWPKIAAANPPPSVKDPHWIYPGQVLTIPDLPAEKAAEEEPAEEQPAEEEPAPSEEAAQPAKEPVQTLAEIRPVEPPKVPAGRAQDSMSVRMPLGMVGQFPSSIRVKLPERWNPDGKVVESSDEIAMATQEKEVSVRLDERNVSNGTRYAVLRAAAPTEVDKDQDASYAVRIGVVEVRKVAEDGSYRALVLQASDALQAGDMLKKED